MPIPQILAAVGMQGLMAVQKVVSNNLANSATPGFKKMMVAFGNQSGLPTPTGVVDLRQGPLEKTGNPLDVALDGPGFLVARTAHGERMIRGGALMVNASGQLATRDGSLLLSESGQPVTVSGDVTFDADGSVHSATGTTRLRRVDADAADLVRDGDGFRLRDGATARTSSTPLRSGMLEQANVESVGEMVQMMQTLRSFELLQQVVRADDDMQQRLTTDVARAR